jgi:hypothetical protein
MTMCGGLCVDLKTSAGNCGGCGTACGSGTTCTAGTCCQGGVTLSGSVQPIFTQNCVGCHSASATASAGLMLTSGTAYGQLVSVNASETSGAAGCAAGHKRVTPGDPVASYLIDKLSKSSGLCSGAQMPRGRAPLSTATINTVRCWIAQGAANN